MTDQGIDPRAMRAAEVAKGEAERADAQRQQLLVRQRFEQDDVDTDVERRAHAVHYRLKGTKQDTGDRTDYRLGLVGTNVFLLRRPTGSSLPTGLAARGGWPAGSIPGCEHRILQEDLPIVSTIRFRPGALSKSDRQLARFLAYLQAYPRANSTGDFVT